MCANYTNLVSSERPECDSKRPVGANKLQAVPLGICVLAPGIWDDGGPYWWLPGNSSLCIMDSNNMKPMLNLRASWQPYHRESQYKSIADFNIDGCHCLVVSVCNGFNSRLSPFAYIISIR